MRSQVAGSTRPFLSRWGIVSMKAVVHLGLLLPLAFLLYQFRSGALALLPDPINYITHFTGDWALWILLGSLAITPLRRLQPTLAPLIRVRRLIGLYAFFYASLHLATYLFLFSGFDLPTALRAVASGHPHEVLAQWQSVWPGILDDLKKRRFIQVGLLSWFILLLLAITSPTAILRAMGGKLWRRVHTLVYLAAVAAAIHYWWLVKAGNRAPWKDTAVLAVLLGVRLFHSVRTRRGVRFPVQRNSTADPA